MLKLINLTTVIALVAIAAIYIESPANAQPASCKAPAYKSIATTNVVLKAIVLSDNNAGLQQVTDLPHDQQEADNIKDSDHILIMGGSPAIPM